MTRPIRLDKIDSRDITILKLMSFGYDNYEISKELSYSLSYTRELVARLYVKLDLSQKTHVRTLAVSTAFRKGWLQ